MTSLSTTVDINIIASFIDNKMCPLILKINIPNKLMPNVFPVEQVTQSHGEYEIIIPLSSKLHVKRLELFSELISDQRTVTYMMVEADLIEPEIEVLDAFKKIMDCSNMHIGGKGESNVSKNEEMLICTVPELAEFLEIDAMVISDDDACLKSHLIFLKRQQRNIYEHQPIIKEYSIKILPFVDYTIIADSDEDVIDEYDDIGYVSIHDYEKKLTTMPSSYFLMESHLNNKHANNVRSLHIPDIASVKQIDSICGQYYSKNDELREEFIKVKKFKAYVYYEYKKIVAPSREKLQEYRDLQQTHNYTQLLIDVSVAKKA